MSKNTADIPPGAPIGHWTDKEDVMRVYDSWPSELKELYDEFPQSMGVYDLDRMLHYRGLAATKRAIFEFARKYYPDWKPLQPNIRRRRKF